TGPCVAPTATDSGGCNCDYSMPTDTDCMNGVDAYCTCAEAANQPCSTDGSDQFDYYVQCHNMVNGAEALKCFNGYVMNNMIDCQTALTACDPSGSGGAAGASGTGTGGTAGASGAAGSR